MSLSEVLKSQRVARRYSIRELARATDISHSYIAQLEAGAADRTKEKPVKPSFDVLSRLGAILGELAYQQLMESAGYSVAPVAKTQATCGTTGTGLVAPTASPDRLIMAFHHVVNNYVHKEPGTIPEIKSVEESSEPAADSVETDNQNPAEVFKRLVIWSDADNNPAYRYLLSAITFREQGNLDKAIDAFESALRRATNWVLRGDIDRLLGRLYSQDHQCVRALSHFKKSFDALTAILEPSQAARLCAEIAWLCCLVDSPNDAIEYYERGLDLVERSPEVVSDLRRDLLHGLATAHSYVANFAKALEIDRKGHEIASQTRDEKGLAWSIFAIAMDEFHLGDWTNAEHHFQEAFRASREGAILALEAICSNEMGNLFLARGELDDAQRSCDRAFGINTQGKLTWGIPHSYELKAKISLARQNPTQAFFCISTALGQFSSLSCEFRMMTSQLTLADISISVGDYDQALEACFEALRLATRRNYRLGMAIAHRILGVVYLEKGVSSRSRDEFTKSLREMENIDHPYELAKSCLAFAGWGKHTGDSNLTRKYESKAVALFKELRIPAGKMLLHGQNMARN